MEAILLSAVLVLCCWCTWKIRKIHILGFHLRAALEETRKEVLALFAQHQWLALLEHQLALSKPLPVTRGWAGSPDFLLMIARAVHLERPGVALECSSGVSTLVLARSLQQIGAGHVFSLEHEIKYVDQTRALLQEYGLEDWATVIHAPLIERHGFAPWYDLDQLPPGVARVDVLVVDGPPAATAPMARYPALPLLVSRMNERFSIYLDDADREDERETVRRWTKEFSGLKAEVRYCEKGLTIVRRE